MEEEKKYSEPKHEEDVAVVSKWFETDRNAKDYIQQEFEECYKIYSNNHWELKDNLGMPLRTKAQMQSRPNMVENTTWSLIEGQISEFTEDLDIIDYPVEEGDDDIAGIMTNLKKYILYKNRIAKQREGFARNFFLYGTGIWHTVWDPTWKGGRGPNKWDGEIRITSIHPQIVFPDIRCRLDIEDGQRIHKAFYKTVEYIKEKYDVVVQADTTTSLDLLGDDEVHYTDGNDEEVLLVETWYKGLPLFPDAEEDKEMLDKADTKYGMHVVWWAGETNPQYLHHENYVYHDPGEDCKFPFIFRARYPRENSVWGFGEAHYLKPVQIALNKTAELILEGHMHFAVGQTFYKQGAISKKQEKFLRQYGTMPNMYFAVNNLDDIKRIHGSGVSPSLAQEIMRLPRVMENLIGRHDISQGRTPGSVVAFRALDLLAAKARVRLRSPETALITAYEDMGNYINHLITRFYTERRAYRILGDNAEKIEYVIVNEATGEEHPFLGQLPPGYQLEVKKIPLVEYGVFKPDDVKKVHVYDEKMGFEDVVPYDDEVAKAIDLVDMMREDESMRDSVTTEYEIYSPELDVKCKVSTTMTSDRAFHMDMAKELFMAQAIDEETFWYVMNNGKFPPFETIINKKKREIASMAKLEAEMAKLQAEANQGMPPEGMEGMPPEGMPPEGMPMEGGSVLDQIFAENPQLLERYNQLPPEMKEQLAAQLMHGS